MNIVSIYIGGIKCAVILGQMDTVSQPSFVEKKEHSDVLCVQLRIPFFSYN